MLILHIFTATVTLFTCISAWFNPTLQKRLFLRIAAVLSLGTGVTLALEPAHLTRATCLRLGIYLLIISLVELRMRYRLTNHPSRISLGI